jgi:hypothetical protein
MRVLYNTCTVAERPKKQTAFRIDPDILRGLQVVKERDGVPLSEQVRRALRAWLEKRGVGLKAERQRGATRKRS